MSQVEWTNGYEDLDIEELRTEYAKYIKRGFSYAPFEPLSRKSSFVTTPRDTILTQSDIERIFSRKLVMGDREQIEALDAVEIFKIACALCLG